MASTINASTTLGLISSADTSGVLQLQTANTTAVTIDASQNVSLAVGTANGVTYLNGSKVLTSGSALTFNGTSLGIGSSSYGDAGTITASIGVAGTTAGGLQLWASSAQEHYIQWGDSTTGSATYAGAISYSHASDFMRFWTNSTEQMRLTSTGLGIGTSSPVAKLQIKGTGTSGQVTSSFILENGSSGTAGMDITGAAGSSYLRLLYGGGPSTGTNALSLGMSMLLEGASAGNVGIGTSAPAYKLHVSGSAYVTSKLLLDTGSASAPPLTFYGWTNSGIYNPDGNSVAFTVNGTERGKFDSSGNLLVGTTSSSAGNTFGTGVLARSTSKPLAAVCDASSGSASVGIGRTNSTGNYVEFYYGTALTTSTGTISTNGTTTAYNTTSDYRLKENVAPMTGALDTVSQLKPVTYTWKANGASSQGFIAHELQSVVPDCVTGEKDAVDEEGNPKYQGIDTSFLVATLTAAIQEQQAIIESLKARLDAANL